MWREVIGLIVVVALVGCAGCTVTVTDGPARSGAGQASHETYYATSMDIRAPASEVNAEAKKVLQEMGVEILSEKTTEVDGVFVFRSATSPELSIIVKANSPDATNVLVKCPLGSDDPLADLVYQKLYKRMVWPGKGRM